MQQITKHAITKNTKSFKRYSLRYTNIRHFGQDYAYHGVIKYVSLPFLSTCLYCPNWLLTQFSSDATQVLIPVAACPMFFFAILHAQENALGLRRKQGNLGTVLQDSRATNISTLLIKH
jgi:hypothetical protein